MPRRVYVAGPLFTPDERDRLRRVARAVEDAGHDPHLPFTPGEFVPGEHRAEAYQRCLDELRAAEAVVAVLDGVDVDSGVAFEVGYARRRGLPVLGVRTDYRSLGAEGPVNLMLAHGTSRLLHLDDWADLRDEVAAFLKDPPTDPTPRLVRDKEPALRRSAGESPSVERVEGEAYVRHVARYIVRSAEALAAADPAGEKDAVADVLQGVEALLSYRAYDRESVRRVKARRTDELGDLTQGYVLGTDEG